MANNKIKVHTIKHLESTHTQEITEEEYDKLQARIKSKYKITGTKEVTTPPEVAGK